MPTDAEIQQWAHNVGVSPDIGYAFVHDYGRLPNSLPELQQFMGQHANEPAPGSSGYDQYQSLVDAAAGSERERFDWTKYTDKRTLDQTLMLALLNGAASLRGPGDWAQYSRYVSGGKGINDLVHGIEPRPDFQQGYGNLQPATVGDILGQMGFAGSQGGVGEEQISQAAKNLGIDPKIIRGYVSQYGQLPPDLTSLQNYMNAIGARDPNTGQLTGRALSAGEQAALPAPAVQQQQSALMQNQSLLPMNQQSAQQQGAGYNIPTNVQPMQPGVAGTPQTVGGINLPQTRPVGLAGGVAGPTQMTQPGSQRQTQWADLGPVPDPTNIRPIVWDSLAPFQQAMELSSAEAQGWDSSEFVRRINAVRPPGQAARSTGTYYGAPRSYY